MLITQKTVMGVYSDTGMNAVEIVLIQTDGIDLYGEPISMVRPYPAALRERMYHFILKEDYTQTDQMINLDNEITDFHISVIQEFYEANKREYPQIDLIGYSGHIVYHQPQDKVCITLGRADRIADTVKIPVATRFIQSDLKSGGQGGPLFSSFYNALTAKEEKPLGILSLGGIVTLTCIGAVGELQAFDVGIGTALLDYWIYRHTGAEMDYDGLIAAKGQPDKRLLNRLLRENFYQKNPPKTVDKNEFIDMYEQVRGCPIADGAATLTAMIAHSIKESQKFLTLTPKKWILVGGGIYNPVLVRMIKSVLTEPVCTGLECGFDNDTLNAQAYAFLSVRAFSGLPISFPQTTGVYEPTTGGKIYWVRE